jgi:hypothetical protein
MAAKSEDERGLPASDRTPYADRERAIGEVAKADRLSFFEATRMIDPIVCVTVMVMIVVVHGSSVQLEKSLE